MEIRKALILISFPVLGQVYQPLHLFPNYDPYVSSHSIHHTSYLALSQVRLSGGYSSHDSYPALLCFATLSGQLFIHVLRFIWWDRWPSPLFKGGQLSTKTSCHSPNFGRVSSKFSPLSFVRYYLQNQSLVGFI